MVQMGLLCRSKNEKAVRGSPWGPQASPGGSFGDPAVFPSGPRCPGRFPRVSGGPGMSRGVPAPRGLFFGFQRPVGHSNGLFSGLQIGKKAKTSTLTNHEEAFNTSSKPAEPFLGPRPWIPGGTRWICEGSWAHETDPHHRKGPLGDSLGPWDVPGTPQGSRGSVTDHNTGHNSAS